MKSQQARFQSDIERLRKRGFELYVSMLLEFNHDKTPEEEELQDSTHFSSNYEIWYSETLAVVKQLMPDRLDDFRSYYTSKTPRRELTNLNYTISDFLRGIESPGKGVTKFSAVEPMHQQANIIHGLANRFTSTLYDIRTLVHADLLDDELHAAEVLNKNGFARELERSRGSYWKVT